MKNQLFEFYYKRGLDYFVFKNLMHLKKPGKQTQGFYFGLMTIILVTAMFLQ